MAGSRLAAAGSLFRTVAAPAPLRWLRRIHTGSVNDYAMFLAGGAAVCAFVLLG